MKIRSLFLRAIKWRLSHKLSIIITILQPLLWLVLYGSIAGQTLQGTGIDNYTAFILPGLLVLVSLSASSSSGIMNFLFKANGSFFRLLISPVKRSSLVLGHILEAVSCSLLEAGILCLVGLFFSATIASGLAGIALITLIVFFTAFFIASLTYTISLCLPNEVVYETLMNALVLPLFFFSSALFPIEKLSGGLAVFVNLNPLTSVINALRHLYSSPSLAFSEVLCVFTLLIFLCVLSFIIAVEKLKRQGAER